MKMDIEIEDYELLNKIKKLRKNAPEGKMLKVRKRQEKILDPAVIAQIKFLHHKRNASRFGAEELFGASKEYHEQIWYAIKAELPQCFPEDAEDSEDDDGFLLDKGKTYSHLLNALTWSELYYEDVPAESDEETSFTANVAETKTDEVDDTEE